MLGLHYYIDAEHLVPGAEGGSRPLLCKRHFLDRLVSSSRALLIACCVFTGRSPPCLHFSPCQVDAGEQAGEIRLRFSASGELDSLVIMLEAIDSALKNRHSDPHSMN